MAISTDTATRIERKLDLLLHLQVAALGDSELPSLRRRIEILRELGLQPSEIGRIVGKEANYISAVLGRKTLGSR